MLIVSRRCGRAVWPDWRRDIFNGEAVMAVARDQAARIVRPEPDVAEGAVRDASAVMAESLRAHLSEETARRSAEVPEPAIAEPAVGPTVSAATVAPKAGKRKKMVLMG